MLGRARYTRGFQHAILRKLISRSVPHRKQADAQCQVVFSVEFDLVLQPGSKLTRINGQ